MKYYKNKNNELFIDPIVKNHIGLIELTKEEFDAQCELNNTPSAEELQKQAKAKAIYDRKYVGTEYANISDEIYIVSLTNDDANGLIQVKTAFEMGISETNFYFENGTVIPLKSIDDLLHLGQFVSIERNKFFL